MYKDREQAKQHSVYSVAPLCAFVLTKSDSEHILPHCSLSVSLQLTKTVVVITNTSIPVAIVIPNEFLGFAARPIVSKDYSGSWTQQPDTNGIDVNDFAHEQEPKAVDLPISLNRHIDTSGTPTAVVPINSFHGKDQFTKIEDPVRGMETNCFAFQEKEHAETKCDCGFTTISYDVQGDKTSCIHGKTTLPIAVFPTPTPSAQP